jgi:uncharacterized membrane protein YvbJ
MFCPNCGKEIDKDSNFCPYCGKKTDLTQKENITSEVYTSLFEKKQKTNNRKYILISIISVIILISAIFLYLNFFPRINQEISVEYEKRGLEVLSKLAQSSDMFDINNKDKMNEVQSEFKKAIRFNPNNISARKNLIHFYLIVDNFKDAETQAEEILRRDPANKFALKIKELLNEEKP